MNSVRRAINLKLRHVDEAPFINVSDTFQCVSPNDQRTTCRQGTAPPKIVFGRNSDISGT